MFTDQEAYAATLKELVDAERDAARTKRVSDVQRVRRLREQADFLLIAITRTARDKRRMEIGNGRPAYRARDVTVRGHIDHRENWRPMSFRGREN